jgi:hypothetical protein
MKKIFFLIFSLLSISNSFIYSHNKINLTKNYKKKVKQIYLIYENNNLYNDFIIPFKYYHGECIVKYISSFLPYADGVASHFLNANEFLINNILNNSYISNDLKKNLILKIIGFSIYGDNVGSDMLEMYYNIVDQLL